MDSGISKVFDTIEIGEAQSYGIITILPLIDLGKFVHEYEVLDQVIGSDDFSITEIDESARVGKLKVKNKLDKRVLLLFGEEVKGAKQNRIFNSNILVGSNSETTVSVSCVEEGRWRYNSQKFNRSDNVMPSSMRHEIRNTITYKAMADDSFESDQSEVWDNIEKISKKAAVKSVTKAMADIYEKKEKDINILPDNYKAVKGQRGFVIVTGGKISGMEYFSNPVTFEKLADKLLKSYVIDETINSRGTKKKYTNDEIETFFKNISGSDFSKHKSEGLGYDHRTSNDKISASALVLDDEIIYFSAQPA